MKLMLITYDLNHPGQNYQDLFAAIKKIGPWCHPVESVWIVRTEQSAGLLRDELKRHIDSNDQIFISGMTGEWGSYGLSKELTDWLKAPLNSDTSNRNYHT